MKTLIKNIKKLVQVRDEYSFLKGKEMDDLPCINNAFLILNNGIIETLVQVL